jgi:uncharacterized membrane protein
VRDAGGRGDSGAGRDAAIGSDAAARVDAAAGGSSAGGCDALTFETYGKEALGTFCARCHSGDEPLGRFPFDTLPEVKLHKAALRKEVVEQRTMPPGAAQPAMTDADRKKFGEWLACGPN